MMMLEYFFSIPIKEDGNPDESEIFTKRDIFSKMNIKNDHSILEDYCAKYPTLFLSFKDIKATNFEDIKGKVTRLIQNLYLTHIYLLQSSKLNTVDKTIFQKYLDRSLDTGDLEASIKFLSMLMFKHFNQKVIVLIDEYDAPLNKGYAQKLLTQEKIEEEKDLYFQETLSLFRDILGEALKDNIFLKKSMITGILRIAKESLFSGLNNLGEDSILDKNFAKYFGFTENDVDYLLQKSGMNHNPEIEKNMKSWYNGYSIGGFTIYNPWSIMNCLNHNGVFKSYWVGTANTALIEQALILDQFQEEMQTLVEGGYVEMLADPKMVFSDIKSSSNALYNLLLFSGYLTAEKIKPTLDGMTYLCQVKIPNQEIRGVFMSSVMKWVERKFKTDSREYRSFVTNLLSGDIPKFINALKRYLEASASYIDSGKQAELLYNGFMWGLFASSINEDYFVEKEREIGKGRADLLIIPKETSPYSIAFIFGI
ncbi:MAG: AAA family ATPase [Proteobacteria bacterium]|nr:AAA family ATPase [Pseudomonadota bacterium]